MGALRRKFPRQPLPTKDKIPHNECRRGTPTNVSLCRYRFIALSLSKRNADRFARSEQDWADVAVETSGFVLRASCFCEFVQFLLDFVRPDGVQHLHDLITRGANYERRLRLKYASTEAARLAPDSIPEPASMPATTKVQLLHHIRVITSVDHLVRDDWGWGRLLASLPSEPYRRFSRIRLSSRWFPDRGCLACRQAVSRVNSPAVAKNLFGQRIRSSLQLPQPGRFSCLRSIARSPPGRQLNDAVTLGFTSYGSMRRGLAPADRASLRAHDCFATLTRNKRLPR